MTVTEARFRDNYPTIYMTMISLIVGLLYENLVGQMQELPALWRGGPESFFVWVQCAALVSQPLLFWFTQTVNAASVRAMFSPRLAMIPILASTSLFFFVSNIGAEHALAWLYVWGFLYIAAFASFRDFGTLYEQDPDAPGGQWAHRRSGLGMLSTGAVVLGGAVAFHLEVFGLLGAGAFLAVGSLASIASHAVWYGEWKSAVGVSNGAE